MAGLTRLNSTIRFEPASSQSVRDAIVWGSTQQKSYAELLRVWFSKPRKVPVELMLAKLTKESMRMPFISRYEVGMHTEQSTWAGFSEFEATSYGLFQFMGFHLTRSYPQFKPQDLGNVYGRGGFDVAKQFDLFDLFMYRCMKMANMDENGNHTEAEVRAAVVHYAGSDVASIIEPNMQAYRAFVSRDAAYMKSVGFTEQDIKTLEAGVEGNLLKFGLFAFVVVAVLLLVLVVRSKPNLLEPLNFSALRGRSPTKSKKRKH
ncbi:MAG: hypothetical protein AAF599_00055 [Bacteroidota bacterium]